jgi:hypothetical protein
MVPSLIYGERQRMIRGIRLHEIGYTRWIPRIIFDLSYRETRLS